DRPAVPASSTWLKPIALTFASVAGTPSVSKLRFMLQSCSAIGFLSSGVESVTEAGSGAGSGVPHAVTTARPARATTGAARRRRTDRDWKGIDSSEDTSSLRRSGTVEYSPDGRSRAGQPAARRDRIERMVTRILFV